MFIKVEESFLRSVTSLVFVEVPILTLFKMLAAGFPHQALLDPLCGTPTNAMALVWSAISPNSGIEQRSWASTICLFDENTPQAIAYENNLVSHSRPPDQSESSPRRGN